MKQQPKKVQTNPPPPTFIPLWDTGNINDDAMCPHILDHDPDEKIEIGGFTVRMHFTGNESTSTNQLKTKLLQVLPNTNVQT
jgi:hypothetical protein